MALFSDSEAYHKQMGPTPSSNGSLDIALSQTQQNWPRADVWEILLQVLTRPVVTQVYIGKMFNKNIEIGFQSAVFHLCQRELVPLPL